MFFKKIFLLGIHKPRRIFPNDYGMHPYLKNDKSYIEFLHEVKERIVLVNKKR